MQKKISLISNIVLFIFCTGTFISSLVFNKSITSILASICMTVLVIKLLSQYYFTRTYFQQVTTRPNSRKQDFDLNEPGNSKIAIVSNDELGASSHRDTESGLFDAEFFPVFIEQRISAARRTLRPVSLVTFEIDGLDEDQISSKEERTFLISSLGEVVIRTLRESDCAFRISANTFAAVMDDTSEAGAVWAAERVRGVLHTGVLSGKVTVCAGVACYPSHALDAAELIYTSKEALSNAKSRGDDQVEIASVP